MKKLRVSEGVESQGEGGWRNGRVVFQLLVKPREFGMAWLNLGNKTNSATSVCTCIPPLRATFHTCKMSFTAPAPPTPPSTQGRILTDDILLNHPVTRHERFYSEDTKLKDPVILRVCLQHVSYCASS